MWGENQGWEPQESLCPNQDITCPENNKATKETPGPFGEQELLEFLLSQEVCEWVMASMGRSNSLACSTENGVACTKLQSTCNHKPHASQNSWMWLMGGCDFSPMEQAVVWVLVPLRNGRPGALSKTSQRSHSIFVSVKLIFIPCHPAPDSSSVCGFQMWICSYPEPALSTSCPCPFHG